MSVVPSVTVAPGGSSRAPASAAALPTSQARLTISMPGSRVWTLVKVQTTSSPAVTVRVTPLPSRDTSRRSPLTVQVTSVRAHPAACCPGVTCSSMRTVTAGESGRAKRTVCVRVPEAPVACGPAGVSSPPVVVVVKVQPAAGAGCSA